MYVSVYVEKGAFDTLQLIVDVRRLYQRKILCQNAKLYSLYTLCSAGKEGMSQY